MWKPALEIIILWVLIYRVILFFEGTRAVQVLRGIIVICLAFILFQKLNLNVLDWLMTKLFGISVIGILIIFHPEIRQGLARLGRRHIFSQALKPEELEILLDEISQATENLTQEKIGALIVLEKNDPLATYIESGVEIDARTTADLIQAIFTPNNPLHDGGLIIRGGRIMAAGCLFPLNQNQELSRIYGTRHRAALGLSEESDAIIIVISEERGGVSLVFQRKLYKDLSKEELILKIREAIKAKE